MNYKKRNLRSKIKLLASRVHGLNCYLLPQNYIYSIYTNNNFYVALISKAQRQCGLKESLQLSMNLAIQIKFLILKSCEWSVSKSETRELSQVQSFLSSEIINPKETHVHQGICFAFSRRKC